MERLEQFYQDVLKHIPRATVRERDDIRQELADHLEDRMEVYLELGCDREEAEKRAVGCMGDPAEIGRAWNQQLSVFWHGIEIICKCVAAILAVLIFVNGWSFCFDIAQGAGIRSDGSVVRHERTYDDGKHLWELVQSREQDMEWESGRHIFRLYRTDLIQDGEQNALVLYLLTCPKNPFHQALDITLNGDIQNGFTCSGVSPHDSITQSSGPNHLAWSSIFLLEEGAETALAELKLERFQMAVEVSLDTLEVIA